MTQLRLVAVAAVVLAGCGASGPPAVPEGADPALEVGRDVFGRNCASCHGMSGDGGRGVKLSDGRAALVNDQQSQMDIVANGKNAMPGFGSKLEADEIESVVRYAREVL